MSKLFYFLNYSLSEMRTPSGRLEYIIIDFYLYGLVLITASMVMPVTKVIRNERRSSRKVGLPVFFIWYQRSLNFLGSFNKISLFYENPSSVMRLYPCVQMEGRTDRDA
jgi:hypothetical protein